MTDVDNQKQDGRVRNWSWIVYPDSAPENWRSILDETGENGLRVRCTTKILTRRRTKSKSRIGIL